MYLLIYVQLNASQITYLLLYFCFIDRCCIHTNQDTIKRLNVISSYHPCLRVTYMLCRYLYTLHRSVFSLLITSGSGTKSKSKFILPYFVTPPLFQPGSFTARARVSHTWLRQVCCSLVNNFCLVAASDGHAVRKCTVSSSSEHTCGVHRVDIEFCTAWW